MTHSSGILKMLALTILVVGILFAVTPCRPRPKHWRQFSTATESSIPNPAFPSPGAITQIISM